MHKLAGISVHIPMAANSTYIGSASEINIIVIFFLFLTWLTRHLQLTKLLCKQLLEGQTMPATLFLHRI